MAVIANAPAASSASGSDEFVLHVGDIARVSGVPVACKVIRRTDEVRGTFVDCRRAGPLAGTYGVLVDGRKLLVVRFRSGRTAQIVFTASHHGASKTCQGAPGGTS